MTGARDLPVCAWFVEEIGIATRDKPHHTYKPNPLVKLSDAEAALSKLQAENDKLRAGYAEAIDDIESWGAYASEYFREKHDLAGTVAKHRAAIEEQS